jgi:hypothetical protein
MTKQDRRKTPMIDVNINQLRELNSNLYLSNQVIQLSLIIPSNNFNSFAASSTSIENSLIVD